MKTIFSALLFLLSFSCKAQEKIPLEKSIIKEFVINNKDDNSLFKNHQLYILGYGREFVTQEIKVTYLSLPEVKEKVKKEGEFNMVRMNDIVNEGKLLKTSFLFLTAKQDYKTDFVYSDNFNNFYCIQYNCEKDFFEVFWCGDPQN